MAETKQIPLAALKFAADLEMGDNGEGAKTVPIKVKARGAQSVHHWFFGKIAHDLAGMSLSKSRLAIDYCHREDEVMGYANKFETEEGLVASGALTRSRTRHLALGERLSLGKPHSTLIAERCQEGWVRSPALTQDRKALERLLANAAEIATDEPATQPEAKVDEVQAVVPAEGQPAPAAAPVGVRHRGHKQPD